MANKSGNPDYNDLLKIYGNTPQQSGGNVRNNGEVYFSAGSSRRNAGTYQRSSQPVQNRVATKQSGTKPATAKTTAKSATARPAGGKNTQSARANRLTPEEKKQLNKKAKRKSRLISWGVALGLLIAAMIVVSICSSFILSLIGDVLGIGRDEEGYQSVVISDFATVDELIDILAGKDSEYGYIEGYTGGSDALIKNPAFCKLVTKILKYDKTRFYPTGTYIMREDMGIEGMLAEIGGTPGNETTITLTFREGITVDEMFEKLEEYGVCKKSSLYNAMNDPETFASLSEDFEFLGGIKDSEYRYALLEGYLYPDTYEFYIGEAPSSVIERYLKNFSEKWDTLSEKAEANGITCDDAVIIASILEREAGSTEEMPVISSILQNRLSSPSFPFINCDSTALYIENHKTELDQTGSYMSYMSLYDTYQKTGLPVGPISCPGFDALEAAVAPESTNYYYFLHDAQGGIHCAETLEQHQANESNYLG